MRRLLWVASVAGLVAGWAMLSAQEGASDIAATLMKDPAIRAALEAAQRNELQILEEQIALCEIPAPPFKEMLRAEALRQRFVALGLKDVRIDKEGNAIGVRPGESESPNVVFSAHLDTVFPEGTDVKTTREGSIIRGPGIADDCRGLAVLISVIRALDEAKVRTPGTITFVGTVGEEGLGDLRGVKHLFGVELKGKIDRFVSVESGVEMTRVGVGSYRYRVTFMGPGGHSFGAFGLVNPIHALGRAIGEVAEFEVPSQPKVTFNVGRIGGGTSVNSIAYEAWMEVDMRSSDPKELASVNVKFQKAVDDALAAENARWQRGELTVEKEMVGDRPAGATSEDSPIIQAAVSVTEAVGLSVELGEGSTDSNLAMSLKIPAVTIGGGGNSSGSHSLDECFDSTDSWKGTQRALLLAVALAQK